MRDDNILIGSLLDECWLTFEQLASTCMVDADWLQRHIDEGLLPDLQRSGGTWRVSTTVVTRIRRVREVERHFDADPELAALVADALEQIDDLRAQLARAGIR